VSVNYEELIGESPDPKSAAIRLDSLMRKDAIHSRLGGMSREDVAAFIHLISLSHFLYRFFSRHADAVDLLEDAVGGPIAGCDQVADFPSLRLYKYRQLLRITWLELTGRIDCREVLRRLSDLAENVIRRAISLVASGIGHASPFCAFAMGKLGAGELNYSSDVDLIFTYGDAEDRGDDGDACIGGVFTLIQKFTRAMEETTADGFLYRVDLKLRPWGRSGPPVLSVDETEHYYEASTEAWERFAWLRARVIAGDMDLGADLIHRLQPFIYLRALGSDDLRRFIQIKDEMARQRKRMGGWNVKLGVGGIRDIEFFLQILQIVNAHRYPELKTTSTLDLLDGLVSTGLLPNLEGDAIRECYLFLRRLENRLQMIDERQTHHLPEQPEERIRIACSLGYGNVADQATLERFDDALGRHRDIAGACFERILPGEGAP